MTEWGSRSSRRPHTAPYIVGLVICTVALYGVMWVPAINGPQLWFGLPSLMVWSSAWMVVTMLLLVRLERRLRHRRGDDA